MNLQTMDYIITTANERSISKAAQILHITQQTLSAHILAVEAELNCQLFVRHIPLEITYAGEEFLKYARSIQDQMKQLRRTFQEIAGEEKGVLKVGITDNRDRIVLLPIIIDFQKKHPGIQMKVVEDVNGVLIQKLEKGEIDICISNFTSNRSEIRQVELYRERVVFAVNRKLFGEIYGDDWETVIEKIEQEGDYRLLQRCPLLMGHEQDVAGQYSRKLMETFDQPPVIKVEAENMLLILGLCANGIGGCFCPEIIVRNILSSKQLEDMLLITLGDEAGYPIRFGWKDDWGIIASFLESARKFF